MSPDEEVARALSWHERCRRELHRVRISYTIVALALFIMGCLCGYTYFVFKTEKEVHLKPVPCDTMEMDEFKFEHKNPYFPHEFKPVLPSSPKTLKNR